MTKRQKKESNDKWLFRLYVAGQTPRSITAFENLKMICDEHLKGRYRIEIVDLVEKPELADKDQVLAIPTVIRKLPHPVRKVIGDLTNRERVMISLEITPK